MNTKVFNVIAFAVGAAIGSVVTWQILEKKIDAKYAEYAQSEIESMREHYARHADKIEPKNVEANEFEDFPEIEEDLGEDTYVEITNRYKSSEEQEIVKKGGATSMEEIPYIISPDEYGDMDDYETMSLNYYSDGVLADDWDNVVDDPEDAIGGDAINRFEEYNEETVFVRDDTRKFDYEVVRIDKPFKGE